MAKRYQGEVVWITGGGTGIGRGLAHRYAQEGASVAVSGRRQEKLDVVVAEIEALGARGLAVPCDVTDEAQIEAAVAAVLSAFGRLDVAIANAGYGVSGRVDALTAEDWRRQLEVNVIGAAVTARHAIPALKETGGRLALIGSVSGLVCFPGAGAYQASKFAVRAISLTLSAELYGSGVSCTLIAPGFVESEIGRVDNAGEHHEDWVDRRPAQLMWPTDKAARVIVDAIHRRKREYVFTGHGRFGAFLGQHFPGLVHLIATRGSVSNKPKQG